MSTLHHATGNATPPQGTSSPWSLDDGPLEQPRGYYDREFWEEPGRKDCFNLITQYDLEKNNVVQRRVSCKSLSCEVCGPKQRLHSWRTARYMFAQEETPVYVVYVESYKVDHLRKYAARRNQPIKSVPISEDRNAVFSPCFFEGAHKATPDEIRDVFVRQRVSRRKLTATGRWVYRKDKPTRFKFISHKISPDTFDSMAKKVGSKVVGTSDLRYFKDPDPLGFEFYKRELFVEERQRKRSRLAKMGFHQAAAAA